MFDRAALKGNTSSSARTEVSSVMPAAATIVAGRFEIRNWGSPWLVEHVCG
jgi:hypothetical protein